MAGIKIERVSRRNRAMARKPKTIVNK